MKRAARRAFEASAKHIDDFSCPNLNRYSALVDTRDNSENINRFFIADFAVLVHIRRPSYGHGRVIGKHFERQEEIIQIDDIVTAHIAHH